MKKTLLWLVGIVLFYFLTSTICSFICFQKKVSVVYFPIKQELLLKRECITRLWVRAAFYKPGLIISSLEVFSYPVNLIRFKLSDKIIWSPTKSSNINAFAIVREIKKSAPPSYARAYIELDVFRAVNYEVNEHEVRMRALDAPFPFSEKELE